MPKLRDRETANPTHTPRGVHLHFDDELRTYHKTTAALEERWHIRRMV